MFRLDLKVAAVVLSLAAVTNALAQAPATPEVRAAIEAEYGVKDAVVKYDTYSEMMANPDRMGGEYFMLPFDDVRLTPAPKGYKPVYISHIGRHGARFATDEKIYENLMELFNKAHDKGKLTEAGEDLFRRYKAFYPSVARQGGELTHKGQAQHRRIADEMFKSFPEVFKGKTRAEVQSTTTPRVIMSMLSFTSELKNLDKDLSFDFECSKKLLPDIHPNSSSNPDRVKVKIPSQAKAQIDSLFSARFDMNAFCSRYFNDADYLEKAYSASEFVSDFRKVIEDLQCLDFEPSDKFSDVFTTEQLFGLWEAWNYSGYLRMGRSPMTGGKGCMSCAAVLRNMIECADRDLASGDVQLSLRFSHDIAVLPLVSYMKVDNFGAVVNDPGDVKNWWRCDFMPMAANFQMIFYRSKRNPEVLVKVLFNGHEASLPISQVAPSFYSWTAIKDYYKY